MGNYFAKAKFRLYEVKNGDVKEIYDHPFLELLENPNDWQVENEIKHYYGEFLGVFGNFYQEKIRGSMSGKIRELRILDPHNVTPKTTKTEPLAFYEVREGNSKRQVAKENIIHFKYLSAYSNIAGKPLISAIEDVLDIDAFQTAYMKEFYENNGFLGQVFTTSQTMTNANFERAKKELRSEYGKDASSHKIGLFDSGLTPIKSAYSLKEMEMTLQRKLTLSEVMTAFRIPKLMLGGEGDTYTKATATASEYTYSSTMIEPALTYIDQVLSKHVKRDYGKKYKIMHDPISPKDVEENLDYYNKMAGVGALSINEIRELENYEKLKFPLADAYILNVGGGAINLTTEEVIGKGANAELPQAEKPKSFINKDALDLHWKQSVRRIDSDLNWFKRRINEFFDGQEERLLEVLNVKDAMIDAFFDSQDEFLIMMNMLENALNRYIDRGFQYAGGTGEPKVRTLLDEFTNNGRSINETSKKKLRELFDKGELNKESINKVFGNFKEVRTPLIGESMAVGAFNAGLWAGYRSQGYKSKIWISQRDSLVRDSHLTAEGQKVGIDDYFIVGFDRLMYPGDPNASAVETINCRCVLIGNKGE